MSNHIEDKPIKMLIPAHLNIKGLLLLGHAKFHRTFDSLHAHSHQGMEFIAVLKGTQQYLVEDQLYTLHGGDVFMTFPNENHGNGNLPQEVAEIVWFQLDCSDSHNFLGLTSPYSDYLFQQIVNYQKRITHTSQKDLNKLRKAFQLLSCDNLLNHLRGYHLFLDFVIHNLCQEEDTWKDIDSIDQSHVISAAVDYIHAHLTENLSIENIAEYCGLSSSKINACFKEQIGLTPHVYILNCKIEVAKKLLKNPDNTVTDVAFHLNFSSSEYFSSVFKKYTGCTPTEYRQ